MLNNLIFKASALDDLDLPVQAVSGNLGRFFKTFLCIKTDFIVRFSSLGKLVLKIPWKNLYGAPVEVLIEDLHLLVVPNQQIKYDPEKEERLAFEAKQAEINRVEMAKKKEAERGICIYSFFLL